MLRWRLVLGFVLGIAVAALVWLDSSSATPGAWLAPLAVLVAVLGVQEVLGLLGAREIHPPALPVYAGAVLMTLAPWAPPNWLTGLEGLAAVFVIATLALMAAFVFEMRRYEGPGGISQRLAGVAFALGYVPGLLAFTVQLRVMADGRLGIVALASVILITKLGDIGAYTIGRLFGRHKLAPTLSPGKTIEGAAGAIAFACAGAAATWAWIAPVGSAAESAGSIGGWLVYGVIIGGAGIVGDLAESLLKRDVGRKDSSTWMPGFGGVLDVLDSILFASPVAYLCWLYGLIGPL